MKQDTRIPFLLVAIVLFMYTIVSSSEHSSTVKAESTIIGRPTLHVCVVITGPDKIINSGTATHFTGYGKFGQITCNQDLASMQLRWYVGNTFIGSGKSVNHYFGCVPAPQGWYVKLDAKLSNSFHKSTTRYYANPCFIK